jgi:uncharacterized protein YjdB
VGDTLRLAATMLTAEGDTLLGKVAVWESGNPAVATVAPTGLVTLVGPGRATITVTSGGVRGSAVLTGAASRVAVATVEIAPAAAQLGTTPAQRDATSASGAALPTGW